MKAPSARSTTAWRRWLRDSSRTRAATEGLPATAAVLLAAVAAGLAALWAISAATRRYRRVAPRYARATPLVAQGGLAGRARGAVRGNDASRALAVLELKAALEEALRDRLRTLKKRLDQGADPRDRSTRGPESAKFTGVEERHRGHGTRGRGSRTRAERIRIPTAQVRAMHETMQAVLAELDQPRERLPAEPTRFKSANRGGPRAAPRRRPARGLAGVHRGRLGRRVDARRAPRARPRAPRRGARRRQERRSSKAFGASLGCSFRRIQFTPDLLPQDITGTYVLNPRDEHVRASAPGPIFANVVLADEINRAPAKTQSALLEAMQERQVTIEGDRYELPNPFLVLATQNPIDLEGTYALPEAQIDLPFWCAFGWATHHRNGTKSRCCGRTASSRQEPTATLSASDVLQIQSIAARVHVEEDIREYAVSLAAYTRTHPKVVLGASPLPATLSLVRAAKANAVVAGRPYATPGRHPNRRGTGARAPARVDPRARGRLERALRDHRRSAREGRLPSRAVRPV